MSKGDIITPLTEQVAGLLGETARIPESGKYIQNGDIGKVIPNEEKLDNSYAYYLMASPSIKRQLGAAAQQTKIRHTSPDKIKDCVAWLPALDYQYKAGKLLDSINDKIANNNAISKQLEEAAKTIYDYWFLQFDFPDKNGRPYKSSGGKMVWNDDLQKEIPVSWNGVKLKDLASYSTKRVFNKDLTSTTYIGTDNMLNNMNGITISRYIPFDGTSVSIKPGDILIANIRPYFKKIWLSDRNGGCNNDVLCIRSNSDDLINYLYASLATDAFFAYDTAGSKGSKMPRGDKTHIMNYPVPYNSFVAKTFNEIIGPFYKKINIILKENQELASLRDFLLPLLMNGQVTFKEG